MKSHLRTTLLLSCCAVGLPIAGCSDPRFEAAQARRDAKIEWVLAQYNRREAGRPETLHALEQVIARDKRRHEQRLAEMTELLKTEIARRETHWRDIQPEIRAYFRKMREGNPERADRTCVELFD